MPSEKSGKPAPVGHMSDRAPASWQQALDDGKYLLASFNDPAEALGCKIQAALNVFSFGASVVAPMPHGPSGAAATAQEQRLEVEEVVAKLYSLPGGDSMAPPPARGFSWAAALMFLKMLLDMLAKEVESAPARAP